MKKYDVLVFGDVCVDLILSGGDVVPEFGQKEKLIGDYSLEMGGSNTIFACQAAKLGLKTVVVGRAGKDQFGDLVCRTLQEAGVSLDCISRTDDVKTGVTVAMSTGEDRAMLTYIGTIDAIEPGAVDDALLDSVRHLHIGSYFLIKKLQPHYPAWIRRLKENGATISLDTNWDPEEKWESGVWDIIPLLDMIFPNDNEAMALTGESTAEKAIARLCEIVPIVAVKKGKDGATIHARGHVFDVPALDVVKMDAVGAGDSFDAGFVFGFLAGMQAEQSARAGCICGSLSTGAAGGTKGQPRLEEMMKYMPEFHV